MIPYGIIVSTIPPAEHSAENSTHLAFFLSTAELHFYGQLVLRGSFHRKREATIEMKSKCNEASDLSNDII